MSRYAYLAIGLMVLILLVGSHWKAYVAGGDSARMAVEVERRERAEATIAMNRSILRAFEVAAEQSRREKERAKAENDTLRRAVRDGALRLFVAVDSCAAGHSGAGDQQARAELVPAVAADLVDIAVDGDDAVRDLNECIDKYNAVRDSNG